MRNLLLALACFAVSQAYGLIVLPDHVPNTNTFWQNILGVEGGFTRRTTIFATHNPGDTFSAINTDLAACPSNQVVLCNAGTYNFTNARIDILVSYTTLRGRGTNTLFQFWGTTHGNGLANIGDTQGGNVYGAIVGNTAIGGLTLWTNSYAQWGSNIMVKSQSGMSVGQIIVLDQLNDNVHVSANGVDGFCNYCGRTNGIYSQEQWSKITALSNDNTTVTIWPPVVMPNWSAGMSPCVFWVTGLITGCSIEDIAIDAKNVTMDGGLFPANVMVNGAVNCQVTNVFTSNGQKSHIFLYGGFRNSVQHCWLYGSQTGGSLSYGVLPFYSSFDLMEDNIANNVDAPQIPGACNTACAWPYNFVTNVFFNTPPGWMDNAYLSHDAFNCMTISEGLALAGSWGKDFFHGGSGWETLYRSWIQGSQSGKNNNRIAIVIWPTNHFHSIIGNVLGTPGINTTYSGFVGGANVADGAIYNIGFGRTGSASTCADDPLTLSTLYLHVNYDTANAAILYSSSNADSTLPDSLIYASKPSFFGAMPFPAFNPTNGAALAANVYAYTNIPAGYRFYFGTEVPSGGGGGGGAGGQIGTVNVTTLNVGNMRSAP